MRTPLLLAIVLTAPLALPAAAPAQVSVNITVAPPPVIFSAPPRVVAIPDTRVYYVPDTTYNVFVYDNRYYSFHDGAWFVATGHRGPWLAVVPAQVPPPVLAIPVRYYRDPPRHVPPGHAKKMEHERHGRGGHCPPGLAKQGRC